MTWTQKTKPALYGAPMRRINVSLDEETISLAKELGEGNLSAGLRNAVQACRRNPDRPRGGGVGLGSDVAGAGSSSRRA